MRWNRWFAMFFIAAILASSCGSSSNKAASDGDVKANKNGILRIPADMVTAGGLSFDPRTGRSGDFTYNYMVLGQLMEQTSDGKYVPDIAQEVKVTDPSTIRVTLRPGTVFSNGEVLDATALKNSIQYNIDGNNALVCRCVELAGIGTMTVDSPTQLTIRLKAPTVGLVYPLLAGNETAPIAPASIAKNDKTSKTVIAAGPFMIESYTAGTGAILVRNPKYWAADKVSIARIEVVNVSTSAGANGNALQGKAVDYVQNISQPEAAALSAPLTVTTQKVDYVQTFRLCMTADNPLGKVQVRQALAYATDQEEINKKVYNGEGEVLHTLWPASNPNGNSSLNNAYKYDLEKAKSMLAGAGYATGLTLSVGVQPSGDTYDIAQVVQQQWAKAGVKLNIVAASTTISDFIGRKLDMAVITIPRSGAIRLTRQLATNALTNVCKFPSPEMDKAATALSQVAEDDPAAYTIWKQADADFTNQVYAIPLGRPIIKFAYASDVLKPVFVTHQINGGYWALDVVNSVVIR